MQAKRLARAKVKNDWDELKRVLFHLFQKSRAQSEPDWSDRAAEVDLVLDR